MNRPVTALSLALAAGLVFGSTAAAQNLVIRDARIIVTPAQVIEKGTLVVEGGRIVSAAAGRPSSTPRGATVINGAGMTLSAGYIDNHRHIIQGGANAQTLAAFMKDLAPVRMRELLESGVTTVQSGGDDNVAVLELKRRVESGEIKGPRIVTSARVATPTMKDEAEVRAAVRAAKASGADSIAEVQFPQRGRVWPFNPSEQEALNLRAGIDEANKVGIPFQVHAISDLALVAAVRMGARKLIHSVNRNWVSKEQAREVAATGAEVSSSSGYGSPVFDVFNQDGKPTFRDGNAWPDRIGDSQGTGQEAGYMPINLRALHDAGVSVSYSTDTTFDASAALAHELKTLNLVFSNPELLAMVGPNSAKFIGRDKDLGTLEAGKLADLVVLGGNPLEGYWWMLNPVMVVKGGVVMVDKRGQPNAGKPIVKGY